MYPTAVHHIAELHAQFGGAVYPGAEALAARLVTLPTHEFVTAADRRELAALLDESPRTSVCCGDCEGGAVMVMQVLFWGSVVFVGYAYAGYPLCLLIVSAIRRREVSKADITPPVSFIIAAHNEARRIRTKIENTLALDYPPERFEVVVASDHSTDGTDEIVGEYAAGRGAADPRGGAPRQRARAAPRRGGRVGRDPGLLRRRDHAGPLRRAEHRQELQRSDGRLRQQRRSHDERGRSSRSAKAATSGMRWRCAGWKPASTR